MTPPWVEGPDKVNRWRSPEPTVRRVTAAVAALAAPPARSRSDRRTVPQQQPSFVPAYGRSHLRGTATNLIVAGASYGLPAGAQVRPISLEITLVLDAADRLHMLTSRGAITNLSSSAASALGAQFFDTPEAVPG